MPIKLRTDADYYSRTVTHDGTGIKIRELEDDALKRFYEAADALKTRADAILTEHGVDVGSLRARLAQVPPGDLNAIQAVLADVSTKVPASTNYELIVGQRAVVDDVCRAGVVSWDIPGAECTPENVVLMPNHVKRAVAEQIIDDTAMSEREAAF